MKHPLYTAVSASLLLAATFPVCAEGRNESWLAQIEASLAATAAHLKVESATRSARADTNIHRFRVESVPVSTETTKRIELPPGTFPAGSSAREARVQQFKLSEQVRMKREALIKPALGP